ncbi:MAG: hypothetical protein K2Q22_15170 [Cytophagales bacterium]|nr:hypothetical protein [Cytophagales bacterium]
MSEKLVISSYCVLKKGKFITSSPTELPAPMDNIAEWMSQAYASLGTPYPKFFKMDQLSKLGFIASEFVLRAVNTLPEKKNIAVVLANSTASLDTDSNYLETIKDSQNYFPSPTVFVYTLPNIVIGEICIRNKFMGENAFFVSQGFNSHQLFEYVSVMLNETPTAGCLVGWLEMLHGSYEAVFYFVEKAKSISDSFPNFEFDKANLDRIYRL